MKKTVIINFFAVLTALLMYSATATAQSETITVTQNTADKTWLLSFPNSSVFDVVLYADYADFDITPSDGPLQYSGLPLRLSVKKVTYSYTNEDDETVTGEIPSSDYRLETGTDHDILYIKNNGGEEAKFWLTYSNNKAVGEATLTITNPTDLTPAYNKAFPFTILKPGSVAVGKNANLKLGFQYENGNALTFNAASGSGVSVSASGGHYYLKTTSTVADHSCTMAASNGEVDFDAEVTDYTDGLFDGGIWYKSVTVTPAALDINSNGSFTVVKNGEEQVVGTRYFNFTILDGITASKTLPDGENTLTLTMKGDDGSIYSSTEHTVNVDGTAPEIPVLSYTDPRDGVAKTASGTANENSPKEIWVLKGETVTFNATDNTTKTSDVSGIYYISYGGAASAASTCTNGTEIAFSETGVYNWAVKSVDRAENESSTTYLKINVVIREAYAVLSDGGTKLTFGYGVKPVIEQSEGKVYNYDLVSADMGGGTNDYTEWYVDLAGATSLITKVVFEPSFLEYKPKTCKHLFYEMEGLTEIQGLQYLNTEDVTDMSNMFGVCRSLTELDLDLPNFSTANVTTMRGMFYICDALTKIKGFEKFNTSRVTDMSYMFTNCNKLEEINFGANFKTDLVTDMNSMFSYVNKVKKLDVSKFVTTNVKNMSEMFSGCNMPFLDLSKFDTKKVEKMEGMFMYAIYLVSLDLSGFNTANVTNMDDMFQGCTELTTIKVSDNWTFHSGVSTVRMFGWNNDELLGDRGSKCDYMHNDGDYAHIDKDGDPGYFTKGKYKIFYDLDADDGSDELADVDSPFENAVTSFEGEAVDLVNPVKKGYEFLGWTGTKVTGISESSAMTTEVKISADEIGNRIYTAHWREKEEADFTFEPNDLVYNGSEQELVTLAGEIPEEMTVYYKIDEGDYITAFPKAKNAKEDYVVWYKADETDNYKEVVESSLTVTISPKPLTVTAKPHSIYFGDEPANDGVKYDGLATSDNETALDGELVYEYTYRQNDPVGEYEIMPGGFMSDNYAIEFAVGTLTVLSKPVDPVVTLSQTEFVYDGEEKIPEILSVTFEGADLSSEYSEPVYQNNRNVGEATVTITNKTGSNYTFTKSTIFVIKPIPFEFLAGQRALIKIPVSESGLNFSSDNQEISVVLRDGGYCVTTSKNVKKGDIAHIKSTITDITVTVADPFENFFDDSKWYNTDIALKTPENSNGWILNVPDWSDNTVTKEGENDVKCQIIDDKENIIAEENFLIKIDKTAPEISAVADGHSVVLDKDNLKNYFLRSGAEFSASAKDNLSGVETVEYSFDGTVFRISDKLTLPYGKNTVYLRSKDVAGNLSEVYSAEFSVFEDSRFKENSLTEITSSPVYYSSLMIPDISFEVDLNGNTIGAVVDSVGNPLNFSVTGGVIKIDKNFLETLLPGINRLSVRMNPLGDAGAWSQAFAGFETQTMRINLDVRYAVASKEYSFVLQSDPTVKAFCQGDDVVMTLEFDERYSDADYFSVETLGIDRENPDGEINFRIPVGALSGGNEKLPVKFFKDGYEFDDVLVFPSDYPSVRNIKVYDDVLALDNFDGQFTDGNYKWYMDNVELSGVNTQFLDLAKYMTDGQRHVFFASVKNVDGDRFRVCPDDSFVIEPFLKKRAAALKTYPNPAQGGREFYIELLDFSDGDFSDSEILIYNQLGVVVSRISDVEEINSVVLKSGFYSGVVLLRGEKVLNFKIVVE